MSQYLVFVLLGFGLGSVYAAVAMGLVVTFKGTGIINFATGAMGMWSAYVFDEVVKTGDFVLPVVVVPARVPLGLGSHPSFVVGLLAAAVSAVGIGLIAHFGVFRPLRQAPPLARVVASVGLMLALQALVVMRFGGNGRLVGPILPAQSVHLAGVAVPRDRLYLGLISVLVGVTLWAWFRFTKIGLATRGSAENERAVSLARLSPQLLAGTTWVISSFVVGVLLTLTAPLNGLNPLGYAFVVVPALACALVGRLTSIGVTVAAALTLGALQSELTLLSSHSWWPRWAVSGLSDAVPFVVLIVVLFVLGRSLPTRGAVVSQKLPEVITPQNRPVRLAMVTAMGVLALVVTHGSYRFGVITSMIVAISALSAVLLTGYVGQISLATAALAGTAGFALSKFTTDAGLPFLVAAPLSALVATAFGVVVGLPALRIRGPQLAVVTLAAAVALERFVFHNPSITPPAGNLIPAPKLFGLDLGVRRGSDIARLPFGFLVLAVLVVMAVAVTNVARSGTGRRFLAIRSNERASAAAGIDVAAHKLIAFAMASFLAGVSGVLIGYSRGQLSAESFTTLVGVSYLAFAYLGGITSVAGSVVAGLLAPLGLVFVVVDRWISVGSAYQLIAGVGLILTAIFNPVGIAGATRANLAKLRRRRAAVATPVAVGVPEVDMTRRPRRAPDPDAPVLLATDGLTVSYGGVRAVDGLDMTVRAGMIVGLIGPNGAGKTSCIDALTGFTPSTGRIEFGGRPIERLRPHERARLGLVRTWQSGELFADLTIDEHLRVAADDSSVGSILADVVHPSRRADRERRRRCLELAGLSVDADAKPARLSLGQQKLLGIARALAGNPRLLLLDEPAAGLDTNESAALGARLGSLADEGIALLLIDHDMGLVLDVCDYVYVLDFGRLLAEGPPEVVRQDDAVIAAYLGAAARPTEPVR